MVIVRSLLVAAVIFGGIYLFATGSLANFSMESFWPQVSTAPTGLEGNDGSTVENVPSVNVVEKVEQKVALPGALKIPLQTSVNTTLTKSGVFFWTNVQRTDNGESLLKQSTTLDQIAQYKLEDMFKNQYFAHEAPVTGKQVGDLAEDFGYGYILIGENLALGNFKSDYALVVDGWMESPGHRANILKEGYTEIGVAVGKGMYEGRETWLAVQTFGTPLSVCPSVNTSLKTQVDAENVELKSLLKELDELKYELDHMRPKYGEEYEAKVDEYNELAAEYNDLLEEVKSMVTEYNAQVTEFNSCAEDI